MQTRLRLLEMRSPLPASRDFPRKRTRFVGERQRPENRVRRFPVEKGGVLAPKGVHLLERQRGCMVFPSPFRAAPRCYHKRAPFISKGILHSFTIYKVSNPHFKWGFANNPSGVLYWLLPLAGLANATILTCPHWGLSSFLTYHCRTYRYFPVL